MSEEIARRFHDEYERLAPSFGYTTRPESAVPWEQVPAANRGLMVAVVAEVVGPIERERDLLRICVESANPFGYMDSCGSCDRDVRKGHSQDCPWSDLDKLDAVKKEPIHQDERPALASPIDPRLHASGTPVGPRR